VKTRKQENKKTRKQENKKTRKQENKKTRKQENKKTKNTRKKYCEVCVEGGYFGCGEVCGEIQDFFFQKFEEV
jgi:hypothetical protein